MFNNSNMILRESFFLVYFLTFNNLIVFVLDLLSHQYPLDWKKAVLNPSTSALSCFVLFSLHVLMFIFVIPP